MKCEGGFTLIELLVVIIIIAILAAIAIPTFLGQRQKAHDASAKSLVRNAMTAVESQYVDNKDFDVATAAPAARLIEPSITFTDGTATGVAVSTAAAEDAEVTMWGADQVYGIGTQSASGNVFYVLVSKNATDAGTTFYRKIGGVGVTAASGW